MSTKTIKMAEGLSEQGKRELLKLLAEHANTRCLDSLLSGWLPDIRYNEREIGVASIEIGGFYTASGNPVNHDFSDGEVLLEDFEVEEE